MKASENYFAFVLLCLSTIITQGCIDFEVKSGGIGNVQVDTGVHVPLSTCSRFYLTQCIQDCFYVSKCNRINYNPSSRTCHFFNVTGSVTAVVNPSSTWNMVSLSDVTWTPQKNYCATNFCKGGESCFLIGNDMKCVVI